MQPFNLQANLQPMRFQIPASLRVASELATFLLGAGVTGAVIKFSLKLSAVPMHLQGLSLVTAWISNKAHVTATFVACGHNRGRNNLFGDLGILQVSWEECIDLYKWLFNYARRLLSEKDILEIFPCRQKDWNIGGKCLKYHFFHNKVNKSVLLCICGLYRTDTFITQHWHNKFRSFRLASINSLLLAKST